MAARTLPENRACRSVSPHVRPSHGFIFLVGYRHHYHVNLLADNRDGRGSHSRDSFYGNAKRWLEDCLEPAGDPSGAAGYLVPHDKLIVTQGRVASQAYYRKVRHFRICAAQLCQTQQTDAQLLFPNEGWSPIVLDIRGNGAARED